MLVASTGPSSRRGASRPIARPRFGAARTSTPGEPQHLRHPLQPGVCQRDWFQARARGDDSTLQAALHGDNIPTSVVENLIETTRRGGAAAPIPSAAAADPRPAVVRRLRFLDRDCHLRIPRYPGLTRCSTGLWRRWRRSAPSIRPGCVRDSPAAGLTLTRRRGQAVGCLFGAGLRDPPVHAAELHRHARRHVHADARDGALDAHHPVARDPAVRLFELHDFRRGGALDAERGAAARGPARAHERFDRAQSSSPARHRQHHRHVLHAGAVCRLRAARAPARGTGPADYVRDSDRDLHHAAQGVRRRTRST